MLGMKMEIPYQEISLEDVRKLERQTNIITAHHDSQPNDIGDAFAAFLIREGYKVVCKAHDGLPNTYYEITNPRRE
jgi:hypothetical protein